MSREATEINCPSTTRGGSFYASQQHPKPCATCSHSPPQIFLYRVTMLTSTSLSLPTNMTIVTSTSYEMAHHVNAVETLTKHLCFWLQDGAQGASAAEYPPDSDLHALFRFPLLLGQLEFTCKLSVGRLGVASATSANIFRARRPCSHNFLVLRGLGVARAPSR